MHSFYLSLAVALCSTLSTCENAKFQEKLTKPILYPDGTNIFDPKAGLEKGLKAHLPIVQGSMDQWGAGWIPKACTKPNSHKAPLQLKDIEVWNFHYNDCPQPWIVCYSVNSGYRRETVHDLFGRLPVKTRAYVRTLMILPQETGEASGYAYTMNQDIVIYGNDIANLMVYIHESGHALDLGGAYTNDGSYLSSSDDWLKYYNQDSKVVDSYAKINQLENVAQNHIVSSYNLNVPGGFGAFKSGWEQISHQYTLLDQRQHTKTSGDKLKPGYACGKRVKNDEIIRFPSTWTSRIMKKSAEGEKPNVDLASGLEVIPSVEFDTRDFCGRYRAAHQHQAA